MKRIFLLAAVAAVGISAFAGERTVSTAADLVSALEELSDSLAATESVVYLEKGDYDVGPYAMKYFKKNTSARYDSESHLASARVRMIGKGTSPRDVVIYGNRTTRVLIECGGGLENLTISNACWSGKTGGGVYALGLTATHSNVIVTCCTCVSSGGGVNAGETVSYRDFDPQAGVFTNAEAKCEFVTDETLVLEDGGWYAVSGEVALHPGAPLSIAGAARLVLCDGASLTINSIPEEKPALVVTNGATLTVYGQADGSGRLTVKGGQRGAGIGGGIWESCGTVVLNGGTVTATGGWGAAGIGGGYGGAGGEIRINGGVVVATGGEFGAGIGGGHRGRSHEVTVRGGMVAALGGRNGAGIGGGWSGNGGDVSVSGGTVTALGGTKGTGIGRGGGAAGSDGSFQPGEDVEIVAGAVGKGALAVRIDRKGASGSFSLPRFPAEYARVEVSAGVPEIVLDEEKARPILNRLSFSEGASDLVTVTVDNVVVGLSYGLGVATTPVGKFVANEWTPAKSDGSLELSAPKSGSALFYRVLVQ